MRVTLSRGGKTASAIVAPGSVVEASWALGASAPDGAPAGTASIGVTPPSDAGIDPVTHAKAYQASGRSVITDAMETGLTYEEAMKQFGDMAPELNPTKSHAERIVRQSRGLSQQVRAHIH